MKEVELFYWNVYRNSGDEPCKQTAKYKNLTVVIMKGNILWDVKSCSLVEVYRLFGGTYCLHLHSQWVHLARNKHAASKVNFYKSTWCHIPEDSTLQRAKLPHYAFIHELCTEMHKKYHEIRTYKQVKKGYSWTRAQFWNLLEDQGGWESQAEHHGIC
jgi:hypothetical protein